MPSSKIDKNPIFIFASGLRCGSTLIQRLLNSCPKVLIWGEQGGYFNNFYNYSHLGLIKWSNKYADQREIYRNKGYNNFIPNLTPSESEIYRASTVFIESIFGETALKLGKDIWGFKEVRYDVEIALFIQKCFPGARFIYLTRNIIDCYKSMKKWKNSISFTNKQNTSESIELWIKINKSFLESGHLINNLYSIKYEDVIAEPNNFVHELSNFLNMPLNQFDKGVFEKKLGSSSSRNGISFFQNMLTIEDRQILTQNMVLNISKKLGYEIDF